MATDTLDIFLTKDPPLGAQALTRDNWTSTPYDANNNTIGSDTSETSTIPGSNVNDAEFNKEIRIITLYIEIILGALGGFFVCLWLWYNRRRKSRVNLLIFHVTLTDLLVLFCACLPQLAWEYDREWRVGVVVCKCLKFFQSFAMMASNNMLVVLGIDRHQAIRSPLREPFAIWKMTLAGWMFAGLMSVPQFIVYRVHYVTDPGIFQNMTLCESIWRIRPRVERQVYLTFIGIIVFYLPFFILIFCYVRIFMKIAEKAKEGHASKKQSIKPGKVHLQSTPSSSLPKAKIKTLKMTVVIVATFMICGLPYHILEMMYSYGDHSAVPQVVASVIGAMAVANSASNPYVFLLFNANWKFLNAIIGLLPCTRRPRNGKSRYYFDSTASTRSEYTMHTDVSRGASTKCNTYMYAPDVVEMSVKNKNRANNYTIMTECDDHGTNSPRNRTAKQ